MPTGPYAGGAQHKRHKAREAPTQTLAPKKGRREKGNLEKDNPEKSKVEKGNLAKGTKELKG